MLRSTFFQNRNLAFCVFGHNRHMFEQQPPGRRRSSIGSSRRRFQSNELENAKISMPKFSSIMPSQDEQQRITKKKDGLMTEVSDSAKKSWAKTKEIFNPQRLNPANLFKSKPKNTSDGPGFFSSLFSKPAPEPRVADVNDFLKQTNPMSVQR